MNSSRPGFEAFIGLDVGGTKIAGGVVTLPKGTVHVRHTIPTHPERGGAAVLNEVEHLAQRLAAEAIALRLEVEGVGLGLCELVSPTGEIFSANCVDWRGLPVREQLSAIAPVVLEADVRAAALAEARLGEGRSFRQFLYVTVGTGIASCLMLEGRPYLGARGATGTMASSPLRVLCDSCGHLTRRTLEETASGPALIARFRSAGGTAAHGRDVLQAAAAGDGRAVEVISTAAEALGSQIAQMIGVLDPEAVIIGGGLGGAGEPFWSPLESAIRRCVWADLQRDLPILKAAMGEDAGWIGAALRAGE